MPFDVCLTYQPGFEKKKTNTMLWPVLTMFRKSNSEKSKSKLGSDWSRFENLPTTLFDFLEIAAKPKKSPGTY